MSFKTYRGEDLSEKLGVLHLDFTVNGVTHHVPIKGVELLLASDDGSNAILQLKIGRTLRGQVSMKIQGPKAPAGDPLSRPWKEFYEPGQGPYPGQLAGDFGGPPWTGIILSDPKDSSAQKLGLDRVHGVRWMPSPQEGRSFGVVDFVDGSSAMGFVLKFAEEKADSSSTRFKRTAGEATAPEERRVSVPGGFAARVQSVVQDRGKNYGHPQDNHQLTAELWGAWFSARCGTRVRFTPEDVCMMMGLQKDSRLAFGTHDDSLLDKSGYVENIGMLREDQRNHKE